MLTLTVTPDAIKTANADELRGLLQNSMGSALEWVKTAADIVAELDARNEETGIDPPLAQPPTTHRERPSVT